MPAPGQVLMSKSKNYFALVEPTGDFSIYVSSHFCKENKIWSTKTEGKGQPPYQLGVQNDGDVVLYDGKMTPLWKLPIGGYSFTITQTRKSRKGPICSIHG
jgi:hypothetical protein